MKRITIMGLTLVTMVALGVVAASALAAPEFQNSSGGSANGTTFTATSGAGELKGTEAVNCSGGSTSGTISGASTVSNVLVDFTGCFKGTTSNPCHSKSQAALSILTVPLSGTLGTVATTLAPSGVGELLSPLSGTEYTSVEGCTSIATKVKGSVIGEVQPVNATAATTGYLLYIKNPSSPTVQLITGFSGGPEDKLTAFGASAIAVKNTVTFSAAVKVN